MFCILAGAAATAPLLLPRTVVTRLPLQEVQGLLWVWPEASPEGAAAAAAAAPALIAELDQPDEWEPRTDWFMREMPISMETVVENVSTRDVWGVHAAGRAGQKGHICCMFDGVCCRFMREMPISMETVVENVSALVVQG